VVVLGETSSGGRTETSSGNSLSSLVVTLFVKVSLSLGQLSLVRVEVSRVERAGLVDVGRVVGTHDAGMLLLLLGEKREGR
jgi:hypothetical protein